MHSCVYQSWSSFYSHQILGWYILHFPRFCSVSNGLCCSFLSGNWERRACCRSCKDCFKIPWQGFLARHLGCSTNSSGLRPMPHYLIELGLTFSFKKLILLVCNLLQVLTWAVMPSLRGSSAAHTRLVIRTSIIIQYLLRLYLIFPLSSQINKATGLVLETAWAGAAYNLVLYMLASHVNHHYDPFFS